MRRQITLRHWGNVGDGARAEAAGIAAGNSGEPKIKEHGK